MMKKISIFLLLCLGIFCRVSAQGEYIGIGFRAGLTASKFNGPLELDTEGATAEKFHSTIGFHIGLLVNFKFTDLVGLRTEINFSQRGSKMDYVGRSYYTVGLHQPSKVYLRGARDQKLTVTNSYIDVPLTPYYKIGPLELFGGVNAGLLISSTAGGFINFQADNQLGTNVAPFEVRMQHNYRKDGAAGQGIGNPDFQDVVVSGKTYKVPESTGAYWDFTERDKALYKAIDLGLVVGLSYYLNESLFLSARYLHGLTDVDRNEYDISLADTNNGEFIRRADKNTSRAFQFSVGFSF